MINKDKLKIAFYAPLKPPDHPIPSGDRQMARMLLAALEKTQHEVFLASRYISYSKRAQDEYLQTRKNGATQEAQRLLAEWEENGCTPDLWFCYHPYDKSPDWLGMEICTALNIPMITAEPCKTGQGPQWMPWRAEAQIGIKMADMNIVMTHSDEAYLKTFVPDDKITWLNPFVDVEMLKKAEGCPLHWSSENGVKLLTVGMMRPGAKLESYQVLTEALGILVNRGICDWSLVVAGGGPGMDDVRQMFETNLGANWQAHVNLAGEQTPEMTLSLMEAADILAWPGCKEAYGMVYLEAASQATPAVALDNMGVPLVVADGVGGLLASPATAENYADTLERLINDGQLRENLSTNAKSYALNERSSTVAANVLGKIIEKVVAPK